MAERKVYIRDGKPEQERKPLQPIRSAYRGSQSTADAKAKAEAAAMEKARAEEQKRLDAHARLLLEKKERRRKLALLAAVGVAIASLGYLAVYMYYDYRTSQSYQALAGLRERTAETQSGAEAAVSDVVIHYATEDTELPDVLPEFEELLKINKNLIGWLEIADILPEEGLPVMQLPADNPEANTYYLTHNLNQQDDRNGTLFVDKDCDVVRPSANVIIYGHHMQSGNMFGRLGRYEDKAFWEKHRTFTFDTIYEHATYEVMYVFRTAVQSTGSIAFKYYQFIDANGAVEFESNMQEMAAMSFYDTGVTASYGDHLLTLSTCDYEETNGRFVVVAKKVE